MAARAAESAAGQVPAADAAAGSRESAHSSGAPYFSVRFFTCDVSF